MDDNLRMTGMGAYVALIDQATEFPGQFHLVIADRQLYELFGETPTMSAQLSMVWNLL